MPTNSLNPLTAVLSVSNDVEYISHLPPCAEALHHFAVIRIPQDRPLLQSLNRGLGDLP
jgi:hypothetical protein